MLAQIAEKDAIRQDTIKDMDPQELKAFEDKEEYDKHMVTHYPCRSCCPYCVMGQGVSNPHKKKEGYPHNTRRLHVYEG